MIPSDLTKDIKTQLATSKGQIDGLIKMLDNSDDLDKIMIQFMAIEGGIEKSYHLLIDEVFRKVLAMKIVETTDICPGNCGYEEKIKLIRNQFPNLNLEDVLIKHKEIKNIGNILRNSGEESC